MSDYLPFEGPELVTCNLESRTISGLITSYTEEARTAMGRYRFTKGSLSFSDLRRVKLLAEHEGKASVGYAVAFEDGDDGPRMTFKVANTPAGDTALLEAAEGVRDGLSVGVEVDQADDDAGVRVVTAARLREVSLVALPAFDSARVERVAATAPPIPASEEPQVTTNPTPEVVEAEAIPTAAAAAVGFGHALDRNTPRPLYGPGSHLSFVRDAFHATLGYGDVDDARHRLATLNAAARDANVALQGQELLRFAPPGQVKSDLAVFLPSGYRPEFYVGDLVKGRPAVSAFRRVAIGDSRSFTIPTTSATSGLAQVTAEEGTNPATGTITDTAVTVSPSSYSGVYIVSRAAVDAATPGLDVIAFNEMQNAYSQATEDALTTYLATLYADGADIDVTAADTAAGGATFLDKVLESFGTFMAGDFTVPTGVLMSTLDMQIAIQAKDTDHRILQGGPYPGYGTVDVSGAVGEPGQFGVLSGVPLIHSWSNADRKTFIVNRERTWVFESPTLLFNYSEVLGPESIKLALFGYFGYANIKVTGVREITRATS